MTALAHPEPYESFQVGDEVWCLAWIGMPFKVVGKNDDKQLIEIDGTGPCSIPDGAMIDLLPQSHFMLTHQQWDSIWYWPDIAGERYQEVFDRFVDKHSEGQIVTSYVAGGITVSDNPSSALAFRLSLSSVRLFGQIRAEPVVAIADDRSSLVRLYDPDIPDDRWISAGPSLPLDLNMVGYRWALCYGKMVLNWEDFD